MKDLIEALNIFAKYIPDEKYPTNCSHDELYVCCDPDLVSDDDKVRLEELGFRADHRVSGFSSYRFGSC